MNDSLTDQGYFRGSVDNFHVLYGAVFSNLSTKASLKIIMNKCPFSKLPKMGSPLCNNGIQWHSCFCFHSFYSFIQKYYIYISFKLTKKKTYCANSDYKINFVCTGDEIKNSSYMNFFFSFLTRSCVAIRHNTVTTVTRYCHTLYFLVLL